MGDTWERTWCAEITPAVPSFKGTDPWKQPTAPPCGAARHRSRMPIVAFLPPHVLPSAPRRSTLPPTAPQMTAWDATVPPFPRRVSRSVVWFRAGDLRAEDHAGLDAACAHTADALAPLLVATPATTSADLAAAERLRTELVARGSALVLRYAADEAEAVATFVAEFAADRVHVRMDAEADARDVVTRVERLLDGYASVQTWAAELREWEEEDAHLLAGLPAEYPRFMRWPSRRDAAVVPSAVDFQPDVILPAPGLDPDVEFPLEEVKERVARAFGESSQRRMFMERVEEEERALRTVRLDVAGEKYGEMVVKEYLRRADAYESPDLGRSMAEVFRQGALSPRRIYEIVHAHERENGRLWRFVYREGSKLILDFLDAREFATLMARRDTALRETVDGEHEAKFWRWRGFLARYVEAGAANAGVEDKPPLVLIHGFGASSFHFRRSMRLLKEKYHVFALDLLGFGRTEKPPTQYTQDLWELMIWDFVRDVVGRPVYIAGNSIGGYVSFAFGVDAYQDLCVGVCLINSAGKLIDGEASGPPSAPRKGPLKYLTETSRAVRIISSNLLLRSLRGRIESTLKQVYPTNPSAADEQLAREIRRDSLDYGAVEVLASGMVLPPPRSLSQLLRLYDGPLLVFQGRLDPLGKPTERANTIVAQYPRATVVLVDAGHCPHEEAAESFADAMSEWMDSVNKKAGVLLHSPAVEPAEQPVV